MIVELYIKRGTFINDDPQKRCYNGCYKASHYEWSEWEKWAEYPTTESAEIAKRIFSRDDRQYKIVETSREFM